MHVCFFQMIVQFGMFLLKLLFFKFDIFISDYFQFGHIWSDFFQVIFEWFPGPVLEGQMDHGTIGFTSRPRCNRHHQVVLCLDSLVSKFQSKPSWWLNQPLGKIFVRMGIFPN